MMNDDEDDNKLPPLTWVNRNNVVGSVDSVNKLH